VAALHALGNGARVVADPMPGLQSCALSVVIRGGARWEAPGTSGWSHLLEHMVFKGAGGRSAKAIVEAIESGGGQINAATGYERTSFQVRCLPDGLALAMEILADLVRRPTLDGGDLAREKDVVYQEIAEAADTPDDRVFDLAQRQAFGDHPLGRPILGSDETLAPATPQSLGAYHRHLYAADRLIVSAAGAVDPDRLLALAEQAFGDMEAASGAGEPEPARFAGGGLAEARRLEQAHLVFLLPGVAARDRDYFAHRLFAEVLGGGMSSRLFQKAREEQGLAYAIDAYAESYEDVGTLGVYAGTSAKNAAPAARLAAAEIASLADTATPEEMARAKAQLKAALFMGREAPLNRAEQAAGQLILFDRLFPAEELAAEIDAVSAADFRRVGTRLLESGRSAATVLGPARAGAAVDAFRDALRAG
jgi:predicted Zn-dependent peptidase